MICIFFSIEGLDWSLSVSNSQCINILRIVIGGASHIDFHNRMIFMLRFLHNGLYYVIDYRVIPVIFCNNLRENKSCCMFEMRDDLAMYDLECKQWSRRSVVASVLSETKKNRPRDSDALGRRSDLGTVESLNGGVTSGTTGWCLEEMFCWYNLSSVFRSF